MNIRNLLFTSMIFCAAPIVCVASSFAKASADRPEVSLTKQEQDIIKKWVREINIKNQHPLVQQLAKFAISCVRDHFLVCLGKMSLGKSKLVYSNEIAVENEKFQLRLSNECQQLAGKLAKKFRINERQAKVVAEQILRVMKAIETFPLNKIITKEDFEVCEPGEIIAEVNTSTINKLIAIYSFILKCL